MKNLLAHSALAKALTLLVLVLLAALPLGSIGSLIEERGASRQQAVDELASTYARPQTVAVPFIVFPYTERWTEEKAGEKEKSMLVPRIKRSAQFVFPETSALEGRLAPEQRHRGIFSVMFYGLEASWTGRFAKFDPSALPRTERNSTIEPMAPYLAFAVKDVRGLQGRPALSLGGTSMTWQPRVPDVDEAALGGIHAPLPPELLKAWQDKGTLDYALNFTLVGQERLFVVPLADDNKAHIASTWPHPGFGGKFLAARREVGAAGFDAQWAVSSLASSARSQFLQARSGKATEPPDTFGVTLLEPLNVYSLTNRAIKYGLLFVALTLAAAYMFELFKDLRLHPIQYALVALAISVFFLLLLALSEKIPFAWAYGLAAGASSALLTIYFGAVLRGWRRGLGLGGYVALLYAALYGLLSSEDSALLLGSLLLFGLLALFMVGTRRVDWYALGARPSVSDAR
ncbi:cell envelope integrity protein CreD [Ramlibacter albus]|uniref:Inner membrane CreD family protein n=1 Tax=Ramlibacter albus TaxID=2079448 RepID=A0A923M749_9BURK|nr:cell envelope integrity protein CreD [Ramlibacter albus]MBC5763949.1 inner membrane CreD family protein [Ramlibacter albus]